MIRHVIAFLALATLTGCHTVVPLPPANLGEPGWQIRQGQAVWQPNRTAPEIAGELLVATHTNGNVFVQFTKNPFPLVIAQTAPDAWRIEFVQANQTYAGHDQPPARLVWFQISHFIKNEPLATDYQATNTDAQRWRLVNKSTGEALEAYFNP